MRAALPQAKAPMTTQDRRTTAREASVTSPPAHTTRCQPERPADTVREVTPWRQIEGASIFIERNLQTNRVLRTYGLFDSASGVDWRVVLC